MQVRISSPKHYESMHGSSEPVRAYLDRIERNLGEALSSEVIDILRISLLIAQPEELAQGKFLEYAQFDWRCGYVAIGVNGDYAQYHAGGDAEKIRQLAHMLQAVFLQISKKKKAKLDCALAQKIVVRTTDDFLGGSASAF